MTYTYKFLYASTIPNSSKVTLEAHYDVNVSPATQWFEPYPGKGPFYEADFPGGPGTRYSTTVTFSKMDSLGIWPLAADPKYPPTAGLWVNYTESEWTDMVKHFPGSSPFCQLRDLLAALGGGTTGLRLAIAKAKQATGRYDTIAQVSCYQAVIVAVDSPTPADLPLIAFASLVVGPSAPQDSNWGSQTWEKKLLAAFIWELYA